METIINFFTSVSTWVQGLFSGLEAVFRSLRQCFVFVDDLSNILPSIMYGVLFGSFVLIAAKLVVGRS